MPARTRPRAQWSVRARGSHIERNRRIWDRTSAAYERRCARVLGGRSAMAWGLWRMPESQLRLLGPVRGRRILELGCGAARWSIALARRSARPVGLDLSRAQLDRAQALARRARARVPLVRASAEELPFRSGEFDLVFCDWGAMSFADPNRTVPEVARVLRRGGRFVFAGASPWQIVTWDRRSNRQGRRLRSDYFDQHRVDFGRKEPLEFRLPYGEWADLFHRSGFVIERLIEPRPPPGRESAYLPTSVSAWARRWPLELIWKVRKE
jgi:SAM-dependent methyltransferase